MRRAAGDELARQVSDLLRGPDWLDAWSRLESARFDPDGERLVVLLTDSRVPGGLFRVSLGVRHCLDHPERLTDCRDLVLDNVRELVHMTGAARPSAGAPGLTVALPLS